MTISNPDKFDKFHAFYSFFFYFLLRGYGLAYKDLIKLSKMMNVLSCFPTEKWKVFSPITPSCVFQANEYTCMIRPPFFSEGKYETKTCFGSCIYNQIVATLQWKTYCFWRRNCFLLKRSPSVIFISKKQFPLRCNHFPEIWHRAIITSI